MHSMHYIGHGFILFFPSSKYSRVRWKRLDVAAMSDAGTVMCSGSNRLFHCTLCRPEVIGFEKAFHMRRHFETVHASRVCNLELSSGGRSGKLDQ